MISLTCDRCDVLFSRGVEVKLGSAEITASHDSGIVEIIRGNPGDFAVRHLCRECWNRYRDFWNGFPEEKQ